MANRIISIEVGVSVTKICEMDFRAKNPKIYKYFSVPTPEGVYDDGFLVENAQFSTAIRQALGFNKVKTKQAVCTITSSKIATREVQLPAVKANQVQALVEANANEYFPINLTDYEIGHLVLGNLREEDGTNKLKVMVMACNKQLIDGYDKLCESVGLHLVSVDYSGNSIYQIMKNEIKEETEMVIRVEEKQSIATIISGQSMVMQRNVVYGIESAVYVMQSSNAFPQKTYEDAFEEMKRIRCIRLALNESTVLVEKEDDELQVTEKVLKVMKEVTEALGPLIGNVARVLDLYNSKNTDNPVKKITLIGIGSEISGISKLFTNELGVKTVILNNVKSISWNHTAGDGNSGRYVTTIGAGLAPIGFINEEKKKSDLKDVNYRNVSILFSILCILICGVMVFFSYTGYIEEKAKEKRLNNEIAQYESAEQTYNKYLATQQLYTEVRTAYSMTGGPNDELVAFLEEFEQTLPTDSEIDIVFSWIPLTVTLAMLS